MNRDNTRCYCDEFCVEKYATHNDCCPDAIQQCVFEHVNSPYIYKPKQDTERSLEEPNEPTTGSNLILEMRSSLRFVVLNETNKDKSKNNYNHGNKENELYGGSCSEFFKLNNMMTCCSNRNDECYMKHYTTRCYCDEFCDRRPNSSDCCVDAFQKCFTSKPEPVEEEIKKNCTQNETIIDNCNKCSCVDGYLKCTKLKCLVDAPLIDEINNDDSLLWKAYNYSEFWGKTLDYGLTRKLGTILKQKKTKSLIHDHQSMEPFDFRKSLSNSSRVFSVQNQANCGASFAFSTLDVASDRAALHIKRLTNQTPSVQHLLSCMSPMNQVKKCTANTVESAWDFLQVKMFENNTIKLGGVVDETCYPFTSQNGQIAKCKVINLNRYKCGDTTRKKLFRISSSYKLNTHNISIIMKEIRKNGPVQMIFKVYSDFFLYKSGIYSPHPKAKPLNEEQAYHSVNVYGWNYTSSGVPYWYAVNTWGTEWGELGYFRIRMDNNQTEIGQHVYAAYSTYAA